MSNLTLQFLVMVDGPANPQELIKCLENAFFDARPLKVNSCNLRDNWIEVWKNKDADNAKINDPNGYMFYRFEVQATPLADVQEQHQIVLARDVLAALQSRGWKAVVCANFEDRI